MEDLLPEISVKTDVPAKEFLKRFEENILSKDDIISKRDELDLIGDWIRTSFAIKDNDLNKPWGSFRSEGEKSDRAFLSLRANDWPEYPLSYDLFVKKVLQHFKPLIKAYNQKYNSRRRIHVQSKESLEPTLTEGAQKVFDSFVIHANKQALHPLDWNRFYNFVGYCKSNNLHLESYELTRLLVQADFTEERAEDIARTYRHIRNFFKRRPTLPR